MVQVDYDLMLEKFEIGVGEEFYLDCNIVVSHSSENGIELDRMEIPVSLDFTREVEIMMGLDEDSECSVEDRDLNLELLKNFRDVLTQLIVKGEEKANG